MIEDEYYYSETIIREAEHKEIVDVTHVSDDSNDRLYIKLHNGDVIEINDVEKCNVMYRKWK